MGNKKGFTLIELLAVIVILAIISALIVPAVTDTINDSEKDIATRSAENYVKTANQALIKKMSTTSVADGVYPVYGGSNICIGTLSSATCPDGTESVDVKIDGGTITSGNVKIENNQITNYSLQIDDYVVTLKDGETQTVKGSTLDTLSE